MAATGRDDVRGYWHVNGVTAHRGNAARFPENTLPAFESGLRCGADWLELDVHSSADGQLVVIHDPTTGRTADRDVEVASTPSHELRKLDMSCGFRKAHGLRQSQYPRTRMPLLAEVLDLVMQARAARVSIQPKPDCVAEVVALVRQMGAEAWIGFNDGSSRKLAEARELMPDAPVFLDTGPGGASVEDHVRVALRHGFQSVVMPHRDMTSEAVRRIRDAGLFAGAWTVNDMRQAETLAAWGVQRFYTDCPEALLHLLRGQTPGANT